MKTAATFLTLLVLLAALSCGHLEAQDSPCDVVVPGQVFCDDFSDGDITDGQPVSWSGGDLGGIRDPASGDLVMTPLGFDIVAGVADDVFESDVLTRTQVRVSSSSFSEVGLWSRGAENVGLYRAGITGDTYSGPGAVGPSNLVIHKVVGNNVTALGTTPVNLDASESDVMLSLQLIGDQIALKAWAANENEPPDAQLTVEDDSFQEGILGMYFLDNAARDDSATFRYFETVPEPSSAVLGLVGLLGLLTLRRHRT